MIDWFNINKLTDKYGFKILWFLPPANNMDIAEKRQNMPNDIDVRRANTCDFTDFMNAQLVPDHIVLSSEQNRYMDNRLCMFLQNMRQK